MYRTMHCNACFAGKTDVFSQQRKKKREKASERLISRKSILNIFCSYHILNDIMHIIPSIIVLFQDIESISAFLYFTHLYDVQVPIKYESV